MVERPETPFLPRQVTIDGYSNRFFHFAGMSHAGSITALPSGVRPWRPERFADLGVDDLAVVVAEGDAVELLLIGTGRDPAHLKEPLKQVLRDAGIRFELMPTPAAASTYNVLLDEGRRVGAALIAV
ncbi:Mth938-like domain-containing protein [Aquabacter sp. P-9]|uniref:Mth938-like domain-containing protein n=1 Tax=Aquabacter sediminis TaxID=3029197 RepID=UPI00237EDCE8|nr:Mth938-like domain-containing protein [Aquabacter sp. P-9]MDE1570352.1 Mth938-like domain-containing protein [Aquabacter sp. P-9]